MPPVPTASIRLPDRYRVIRHIANGGMASVWEACDELLRRDVAVKVLAAHLTSDETARVRFQREARAAAGLSGHPHVVTIYDIGEYEGRSFIVMERMERSVADVLAAGEEIDVDRALRWLRAAGSALDAAHESGIVHRDIKPANMLLDRRDRLALADFGIARLAYETNVTATGTLLGTSSYISPEQALGDPAASASDRYALAVVAFQLLTGDKPFRGEHFAAQARAHIDEPPPIASSRRPELGTGADEVLRRGMAKDPDARWATATEFVDALAAGLQRPATATPAAGSDARASVAATTRLPAVKAQRGGTASPPRLEPRKRPAVPPTATVEAPERSRRRWSAVAVAAAALLLTGLAMAFALGSFGGAGNDPAPAPSTGQTDAEDAQQRAELRAEERAEERARRRAERTATTTPEPTATPAPTRTAAPEPTPTATPAATPVTASDPAAARPLNDRGFALMQAQRYDEAIPHLRQAYELCRGSRQMDPCGYATYNYGAALRRSGNAAAAIPILEERMQRFGDNRYGDVAEELEAARSQA